MLAFTPTTTESQALLNSEVVTLIREWRASVIERLSASTADAYTHALDHYLRYLEEAGLTPDAAAIDDIAQYVAHCRAHCRDLMPHQRQGRSGGMAAPQVPCATMLRVRLTVIRSFYDTLTAQGLCDMHPLRGGVRLSKLARGEASARPQRPAPTGWTLTREQAAALAATLDQASARDRLLVALVLDTGLAAQDLCALRLSDIAPRGQALTLTHPSADVCARDAHAIICSPVTAWLYRCYLRARPPAKSAPEALFHSQSCRNAGQAIGVSMVEKTLRRIGREAGVAGITARNLRQAHTQLDALMPGVGWDWLGVSPTQRRRTTDTPRARLLSALFGKHAERCEDTNAPRA